MKEIKRHLNNCSAPICEEIDCSKVVWCAGEEVCSKTKGVLRSKMLRINKEFKLGKFQDSSWTKEQLVRSSL
jgi:hypothetical protein